ncbi:hypothetical protein A2U01_0113175, partial [Trifolium medium]|nr:hypothetical protein [Trifolium medium]
MFWLLRGAQCLCCVVGFVLLAARRARVACAARSIVVVALFLFCKLRYAQ